MRAIICALFVLFLGSVSFAGEHSKRDVREKMKPIHQEMKQRRMEQHKANRAYLEAEVRKLDIPQEVKDKILKRITERCEKRKERRQKRLERRQERKEK